MRLSEAIRLGATMHPQAFGQSRILSKHHASCALNAACDALGQHFYDLDAIEPFIFSQWGEILRTDVACPTCGQRYSNGMFGVIIHMNDRHEFSRERIADFIELHEPIPEAHTEELKEELCD